MTDLKNEMDERKKIEKVQSEQQQHYLLQQLECVVSM